jgi:hypothetical protein
LQWKSLLKYSNILHTLGLTKSSSLNPSCGELSFKQFFQQWVCIYEIIFSTFRVWVLHAANSKGLNLCDQGCLQFRPFKKCIYLIGIVQTLILCSKALAVHLESILRARPFYLQRHGIHLIICPYGKAIWQFSFNWCWTILSSANFGLCYDELKCTILPNCKTCAWNFSRKIALMWIMLDEDLFMNIFYHTHVSCVVWQSLGIDPKHLVACALQGRWALVKSGNGQGKWC